MDEKSPEAIEGKAIATGAFTDDEIQQLHEMVNAYRFVKNLGKVGKWLVGASVTVAGLIVSIQTILGS